MFCIYHFLPQVLEREDTLLILDSDKEVRNDATFNKDYLAGRYGAVPLLKEFYPTEEN